MRGDRDAEGQLHDGTKARILCRESARSYAVVSWHICNLHLIHFLRLQQVMMGLFILFAACR